MPIAIHCDYPPTAVPIVALKEIGLVGGGSKDIVPQKLNYFTPVGGSHGIAPTT